MKAIIHKMFCYLLAGLVFISSTGFGLVEHSCLMSGKKKIVMSEGPSCCSAKKSTKDRSCQSRQTSLEEDACCTEATQHARVDVSTSLVQVMSNLLVSLCVAVISLFSFLFNSLVEALTASAQVSHSPPLSGRALLIFLHTFLILFDAGFWLISGQNSV